MILPYHLCSDLLISISDEPLQAVLVPDTSPTFPSSADCFPYRRLDFALAVDFPPQTVVFPLLGFPSGGHTVLIAILGSRFRDKQPICLQNLRQGRKSQMDHVHMVIDFVGRGTSSHSLDLQI